MLFLIKERTGKESDELGDVLRGGAEVFALFIEAMKFIMELGMVMEMGLQE